MSKVSTGDRQVMVTLPHTIYGRKMHTLHAKPKFTLQEVHHPSMRALSASAATKVIILVKVRFYQKYLVFLLRKKLQNALRYSLGLPWWLSGKESTCQYRSGKITHAQEQLSPCTMTVKPVLQSLGAATTGGYMPQNPCSIAREATAMRSLSAVTREKPHSLELEKSPCSNKDPAQPKMK